MDWLRFILIFVSICIVSFFIARFWVSGIDLIISTLKKMLGLHKKNGAENWHTLEDIRDKNKEDPTNK